MIGGFLAGELGAGFLGGIVAGFLAGYVARFISQKLPMPESIESLKPILIIPLLASLVTGLGMIYVIGEPMAAIEGDSTIGQVRAMAITKNHSSSGIHIPWSSIHQRSFRNSIAHSPASGSLRNSGLGGTSLSCQGKAGAVLT